MKNLRINYYYFNYKEMTGDYKKRDTIIILIKVKHVI